MKTIGALNLPVNFVLCQMNFFSNLSHYIGVDLKRSLGRTRISAFSNIPPPNSTYVVSKNILQITLKGNVLENYKQLNQLIMDTYNEENQKIIGCPTTQQVKLVHCFW